MIKPEDILKATILIVDDQKSNVLLLEQMLGGAGYVSVTSTTDPRVVCDLHRKNRYDLILLDLEMPVMDGFEVMESLKEFETDGYLPVLVITADPGHKLRALKAGAKDFVSKPLDLGEVLLRVRNMVEVRLLHLHLTIQNFARLENSQRVAGLGDWEYNVASGCLSWSEGIYRILGITRKNSPPSTATFDRLVHPDDLAGFKQSEADASATSQRTEFEHRIIRPDGEVRSLHRITETSLDEQGRLVRLSGTIQDITERNRVAGALRASEEQVRKLLG